jgi:hypothetical protein
MIKALALLFERSLAQYAIGLAAAACAAEKDSLTGQSTSAFCGPSWGRHAHRTASLISLP